MNANETVSMYELVPVVSELNRVPGFDPLKFLRKTKDGLKLDVKIKKLWFRLKYPSGRIRLSALKITDQLAIIEARVYFDKDDTQPVASFTAQRENKTTPGGLYIESAQHSAVDEALSAAGFGIQFIPAYKGASVPVQQVAAPKSEAVAQPKEIPQETITVAKEAPAQAVVTEPVVTEQIATEQVVAEQPVEEITDATQAQEKAAVEVGSAPVQVAEIAEIEPEEVTETVDAEEAAGGYTNDMLVDEICARMSVEEAGNLIVTSGTCKGWTLSQVADKRPVSLKWYLTGYTGDDNILRAGARIMQTVVDAQKAS